MVTVFEGEQIQDYNAPWRKISLRKPLPIKSILDGRQTKGFLKDKHYKDTKTTYTIDYGQLKKNFFQIYK